MDQPSQDLPFPDHPRLAMALPRVMLGSWPTTVEPLEGLGSALGLGSLHVKRDDLSGRRYGSNKVRKLEFLLGEALQLGARGVVTYGFAGTNHGVATAHYARELGLSCTVLLLPQPPTPLVAPNLLASLALGARLVPCANWLTLGLRWRRLKREAYPIPGGGTCPLGVAAYVNAAYELRQQIQAGVLPEPDLIYVPFASMGTALGLSLGLQAAGLTARIVGVRVVPPLWATRGRAGRVLRSTLDLLRHYDPTFAELRDLGANLELRDDQLGAGYAHATTAGTEAATLLRDHAGIPLSPTYSAKALAALVADARAGRLRGRRVLYWNTFNTRDLSDLVAQARPQDLPRALRKYLGSEALALGTRGTKGG